MSAYRKEGTIEKTYATMNGIAMLLLLIALVACRDRRDRGRSSGAFVVPAIGDRGRASPSSRPASSCCSPTRRRCSRSSATTSAPTARRGCAGRCPGTSRKKLSARARNHNIETLKVNDKRGNPVEIAAVVVWRVEDTAQALFDVEDFEQFVQGAERVGAAPRRHALQLRQRRGPRGGRGHAARRAPTWWPMRCARSCRCACSRPA